MYDILDLLKTRLPSSAFDSNDETLLIQNNIDPSTLIINLKQLVTCYLNVDISFDLEQYDQNNYKLAEDICQMLYEYDKESTEKQLSLVYQKLSEYYENVEEDEDALCYLQKIINLEEPTISTLYRLGYLNMNCDKFDVAVSNYENLLTNESVKDQKELSQIIQEKLTKAKTNLKKIQRRSSITSNSTHDSEPDNEPSNHSTMNRLSRNPTNISTTSHAENENENKIDRNVDNIG
jgi:tetratricopeptide (TPR) repeat protein